MVVYALSIHFQKMSDKSKALRADNIRISLLVWKLHEAIERAKEQDILFNEVDDVRKLATDSFKIFLDHGVRYNTLLLFFFLIQLFSIIDTCRLDDSFSLLFSDLGGRC